MRNNLLIILIKLPKFFPSLFKKALYWQSKLRTWQIKLRITLPGTVCLGCANQQTCHSEYMDLVCKNKVLFPDHRNFSHNIFYIIIHSKPSMYRLGNTYTWLDRADVRINIHLHEYVLKFLHLKGWCAQIHKSPDSHSQLKRCRKKSNKRKISNNHVTMLREILSQI